MLSRLVPFSFVVWSFGAVCAWYLWICGLVAPSLYFRRLVRFPLGTFLFRGLAAPCLCSGRLVRFPLATFVFRGLAAPSLCLVRFPLGTFVFRVPWFGCSFPLFRLFDAFSASYLLPSVPAWYLCVPRFGCSLPLFWSFGAVSLATFWFRGLAAASPCSGCLVRFPLGTFVP